MHANEVRMHQLRECFKGNYGVLAVDGVANPIELAEAYSNLFYEYCDILGMPKIAYRIRLAAETAALKARVALVSGWIEILSVAALPSLVEAIKIIGFDYEFNNEDPDSYESDIASIRGDLNLDRLQIKLKEAEMQALLEEQEKQEDADFDDKVFKVSYFRINNYAKREAVNDMSFVEDYCIALRDYNDYCEQLKKARA